MSPSLVSCPDVTYKRSYDRVTLSIGTVHAGRQVPNDTPWETLSLRISRQITVTPDADQGTENPTGA